MPNYLLIIVGFVFFGGLGESAPSAGHQVVDRSIAQLQSPFPDDHEVIDSALWRLVRLEMDLSHGGRCEVTLLRPLAWLDIKKASKGVTIGLLIPEMGVSGEAKVIAIEPCPEILEPSRAGSRTVTGKFVTSDAEVIELIVDGLQKPITATAGHPFWSLDRGRWTAAGDLHPGERLRTQDGSATVTAVSPVPGSQTVYNLEVHKEHTFFVSEAKLWVHNKCEFFPKRIVQLFGSKKGGAAFYGPDGTAYCSTMHVQLQEYLHSQGLWKSAKSPGEAGWAYGFVDDAGKFEGEMIAWTD